MPINSFVNYPMSWRPDRHTLKRPIYHSIASLLEQDIASGLLVPGTKLPPQRELADFLDVNFTTITRAYKLCEAKGLIYAITGSGTFVATNATRSIAISKDKISHDCIDLGLVASFEQSNSIVAQVARRVMHRGNIEELLNYNDPTGMPHHKLAGLSWMQAFGIQANINNIAIASGGLNALVITLFALFEPGQRIAVDVFTYSNFIELARMYRIQLVPIPGDTSGMLPQVLDNQCQLLDIRGIFLMPSCTNPTTVMMTDGRKREIANVIQKHNLLLIEDDIHAFLTAGHLEEYKQPMYSLLPDQTIYISSTTKSICSGLRIAYIVFGEKFKERIERAIFNINVKTSSLDAEIISELIVSGSAAEIVAYKKELVQAANKLFSTYFPQTAAEGHPLSFFKWIPLSGYRTAAELESELLQQGVRIFHSDWFLSGASTPDKYVRVALSSSSSLDELDTGLKILKQHMSLD
ncbi:PLP-dependent aminotransferase family protein [Paenibacillus sp. FSL H7-0737]|uniref:aminotransferase-like domain-containing protein n=1 Tax=unclassified Paenibacillus TaxID=185978 RepID=UPI0004F5A0FC|nr:MULTISPECIES: PLP-dependent aminotransferase family protein [unclassified Paenibacillus]AIQ25781.1 GntR family transcriptional regulator [Paenibacillus sp. FSL H7-0737]KAA1189384.1 PLP-dependent aminotransferase family protein [Paenibacillus sp. B2(2019)]